METAPPDRLRFLIDTLLATLDEPVDGDAIAKRAFLSRFHFDRLVARGLKEAPATFRRRLLLERAAWQLLQGVSVTETGLTAGYDSTEAFSRAFTRAFGFAPSRFAKESRLFRLDAPNGIHFHPPAGLHIAGSDRRTTMDLTDRLLEHDAWLTTKLIESAGQLTDAALDREIRPGNVVDRFAGPEPSVRAMLANHVFVKEIWIAAMSGTKFPGAAPNTIPELRERHAAAVPRFRELTRTIRERGEWDDAFVDALCDPPESFTYGSVIADIVEQSAHRRFMLIAALRELGLKDVESSCAIDWERGPASRC